MARNYTRERLMESPARKKARAMNNKARRKMIREGKASVGDGTHVDHKDMNTKNNSSSNLRVQSPSKNSARHRTAKAGRPKGGSKPIPKRSK
jgi:hypothetical protein